MSRNGAGKCISANKLCPYQTQYYIDTCIFDESAYNFASEKMRAFIEAAKPRKVILIMPDPIRREIFRHINDKANEVLKALKEAKRKAPFLVKWKDWPVKKSEFTLNWELKDIAKKEVETFLKNFTVVNLDYSEIVISKVMDWYDKKIAPFGDGKKRKEFPDAFSFAIVLRYALKNKCSVAIVSTDSGFGKACERYSEIMHFNSLPAFTEALISSDKRVESIRVALDDDSSKLKDAIAEEFPDRGFYPAEDISGDVEDVEVEEVTMNDIKIIAVGEKQCTVAFESTVEFSAYVTYDDPDSVIVDSSEDFYMAMRKKAGTVAEMVDISGVAKLSIGDKWDSITSVDLITIDDDDIEVTTEPDEYIED